VSANTYHQAYVRVLHWIEAADPSDPGLQNPYFFCESGERSWAEVATIIGKGLHNAGKLESAATRSIPESEYGDLWAEFTPDAVGCSCRHRAERLRAMGWKPQQLTIEEAYVQEELPQLLAA
jgi:hypothetical protein